ncbi:MAG TPA: EAL domain-containing protein [Mycobacteriales bacterium]|nr:EAL domain-containing protein [Mycobacteriales bacterium]
MTPAPADDSALPVARALAGSPELAQAVVDTVPVALVACDADGRITALNQAMRALCGPTAPLPGEPAAGFRLLDPATETPLPPPARPLARALRDGVVEAAEVLLAPPGSGLRLVRCDGRALRDHAGHVVGAVVAMTDMTEARAAELHLRATHEALTRTNAALARSEAEFRAAFERGPTPMCRLDGDGVVVQLNPALRRLLARSSGAVLGNRLTSLVVPSDRQHVEVALAAAGSPDLDVDLVEVRFSRPDGSSVWCELAVNRTEHDGTEASLLVQIADVDARKRREDELERRAASDELTGLPNRSALLRTLAERLAPGVLTPPPGLLFLDLDGFKAVNDSAGHAVGDEVLVEIAARLRAAVRPEDLVARLGGDEFVVLHDGADGAELVDRLHEALHAPVPTSAGPRAITASIGTGQAAVGEDPVAVLARADAAMYDSKARRRPEPTDLRRRPGRNPALQPRIAELLATAEQEGRLDVEYQPVVDLATGATVGTEALLRMRTRSGKTVAPDAFVPVAEATGDIHALGEWVLRRTCAQAADWKALLPAGTDFGLGVNLSPRQLDDPALLDRLDGALEESGLDPTALVLEITERLLTADTDGVRRTLAGVRDRGVHLACDDFGSGYASLRYLDELPVDVIKIDRSWTARLAAGDDRSRLARGVLRLATTTGLVLVAEGIETEDARLALVEEGCRLGQGYLFSRPVSAEALTARLTVSVLPVQRALRAQPELRWTSQSPSIGSTSR